MTPREWQRQPPPTTYLQEKPPPQRTANRAPPGGATGQTPHGKRAKSEVAINVIAAVGDVCEEPSPSWQEIASSSPSWSNRQDAARRVHLEKLAGQRAPSPRTRDQGGRSPLLHNEGLFLKNSQGDTSY